MSMFETFKASVFGQESGNGAVDTSKPNYAGARGKGQILEGTFKGLQRAGKIPSDYQWANPAHNEEAAVAYMQEAWDATGGKPDLAAAYYYGGPKAVRNGQIVSYKDKLNPKAPDTIGYAQQVVQRMGLQQAQTTATREAQTEASIQAGLPRRPDAAAVDRGLQASSEAQVASQQARPDLLEIFGASMAGNLDSRIAREATEIFFGPKFAPVEGYKPDLTLLPPTADMDLINEVGAAKSPAEASKAIADFEAEQLRTRTLMDRGMGVGMAVGLFGELATVSNFVAPLAAARLMKMAGTGSLVAAAAGQTGRAVSAGIVESALSGTVLEAAVQGLEGKFRPFDLAISAVADGLIGGGLGALAGRTASADAADALVDAAHRTAVDNEIRLATLAEKQAGQGASVDEVRRVMESIRADEVKAAAISPMGATSRVLDVDHMLKPEAQAIPMQAPEVAVPVRQALADALDSPALQVVNETSRATRHLIGYLQKALPDAVQDVEVTFAGAVRGDYNPLTNKVTTPGTAAKDLSPNGRNDANVLAHEVVHAATGRMIAAVRENVEGVSPSAKAAVTRLEGIRLELDAHLKAKGIRQVGRQQGADYAASDLDEFVAQVMSDPETRKALAEMPASGGFKDMLSAFADAVVRLLGLDPKTNNSALKEAVGLIDKVIREGEVPAGTPISTFIKTRRGLGPAATPAEVANEIQTDPVALRIGLNLATIETPADRAKAQAILALHKKAIEWDKANPMDDAYLKRAKNLADNSVFNVASNGLVMLKSASPLVRMIASELLEDASGVLGKRKATASIAKHITERMMLGNAINDVQSAYKLWQAKNGAAGYYDDMVRGTDWAKFNRLIAEEIENRLAGVASGADKNVSAAADSLEAAYQRAANEQRRVGTLGSEGLPLTSRGYMPHRMNAKAVLHLSNAKKQVLHQALTDQFITIEGWDASFSDMLASKYLARVQARAAGDYGSNIGGGNTGTASLVEEALRGMDLPPKVIAEHMEKFTKGAANFTKGRTKLDLNRVYNTPDGEFKLLDIFDTDQLSLLRAQVGRASGDVALTNFGVRGKPGLQLLRDAMQFGEDGKKADNPEREAFDQMAAEFMNEPLNEKVAQGKWMDRAMAANTLVRLGGVGFNQLSETLNGIAHIGVAASAKSIGSIKRLREEIIALSKGEQVDNPFLTSIEHTSGAEFGTDAYKVVLPFDSPDHLYPTYGAETPTLLDRILRGGVHAQAMLSGWRMIHSAQQRGMAEQIVKKIARYVKEGKDDVALEQFGVNADMRAALRKDIDQISKFDSNGNPLGFDVTKITDPEVQAALIQAVHRGTAQIIQGTFIGERGKWAHEGWLKLLTQFRTFSITSMEKQWGRQRNSRGDFAAFGLLMGTMSMAWPIYMARVYANSVGREDQAEYIAERSSFQHVVRATMNYTAMTGMAGDAIDLMTAVLPDGYGITPTGGRAGQASKFVGNYIAPSLSLVDDIWKFQQGILDPDRDTFGEAAKLLPGSRIPYLLPFVNALND